MTSTDDLLAHHGVKGMKWGVRKSSSSSDSSGEADLSTRKGRLAALKTRGMRNISVTTKNGETLSLEENKNGKIANHIASLSGKRYEASLNYSDFTIKANGKTIGDASFNKVSNDELNLVWLGVNSSQRGNGYGSAVFDAAVKMGKESGVKKLTLEVPGNAPDARHIYEKRGFKVVKEPSKEDLNDSWGGLTHMALDVDQKSVKHADVVDEESDELELAIDQTYSDLDRTLNRKLGVMEDVEHSAVKAFLAHHGVKGMKWGVRKDQHRTYSEKASSSTENMVRRAGSTVQMTRYFSEGGRIKGQQKYNEEWYNKLEGGKEYIEKGDTLNRIVRGVDDRALSGRLYVSQLESDNEMYKAVIPAVQKKFAYGQKEYHSVYQVELEAKKRMAMPSEKVRIDTFIDTIQTPEGRKWMKESGYKDEITELNAKEQGLKAYKKFNKVAGNQELPITDVYFNKVRKQGYDAILDDNDAGIWSKKPMILLSAQSTVKVKDVRQLSADEINQAQRNVLANRDFKSKRGGT